MRSHLNGIVSGLLVCALAWTAIFAWQLGKPTAYSRWVFEMFNEKKALSERVTGGRRLLVAGGSSALFGIRACDLQADLKVPVVNVALYAGFGLPYMLHQTQLLARDGDIVLLSLEYTQFNAEPDVVDFPLVDYLFARDTDYFFALPWPEQLGAILRMPVARAFNSKLVPLELAAPRNGLAMYGAPRHLNACGDTLANNSVLKTESIRRDLAAQPPEKVVFRAENEEVLLEFARWAKEHRIRLLAIHPAMERFDRYEGPAIRAGFARVERTVAEAGIPWLDTWTQSLYPRELFMDTVYHLDSVGAGIRTERLVELLRGVVRQYDGWAAVPRQVKGDFPFAQLDSAFAGWEPVSGFGELEGPYPQWNLGPVIWASAPESVLLVHASCQGTYDVHLSAKGVRDGQEIRIVSADAESSRYEVHASGFEEFRFKVRLSHFANRLRILQPAVRGKTLLLRELRVERADGDNEPCIAVPELRVGTT